MKSILQKIILALVVGLLIIIMLYVNKLIYFRLNVLCVILINFVSVVYVVLLIHRLIKHFEHENNLQE
jgi:hypothetical protein